MKTVIINYSIISPEVLAKIIESAFEGCICLWKDIDEDYFELTAFFCHQLEELEGVLAEYI